MYEKKNYQKTSKPIFSNCIYLVSILYFSSKSTQNLNLNFDLHFKFNKILTKFDFFTLIFSEQLILCIGIWS